MISNSVATTFVAFISLASAQYEGWVENQVNASMCTWSQPRAGVIRDTVYLDGGRIQWNQGLSNGEYGPIHDGDNPLGMWYTLNFSKPFEVSQNVTALFDATSKARGGSGSASNDAPNYWDGAMLYNDAQMFLLGGLVRNTSAYDPPPDDEVLSYLEYQYGPERGSFSSGWVTRRLPDDMTRYISFGGAASAPSENKAWYFGGMRAPDHGPIFRQSTDLNRTALNVSDTLITLDMETQISPEWSNTTIDEDSGVRGRANPEVVWVPVGEQGILVVLGGVTYPDWVGSSSRSDNPAQSKEESDEFMQTIDIYDVANDEWYRQETEDGPTARTRGCAVVAPAQDQSSFNIYYYGGYDGRDPTEEMSDEVWVLSLPSFTWTQLSEGRTDYGRSGHKCFMPYPDQMMVIGGITALAGSNPSCLMGGIIQMFNLTSGEWMDEYDPEIWNDYGVPSAVQSAIGGDATGGATETSPSSGWTDDDLADVFDTSYDTDKIETWYPYTKSSETDRPVVGDGDDDEGDDGDGGSGGDGGGGGGGVPAWVAPTLGVVLGLVFVTALLVAFCLWRRRKILRGRGSSDNSSTDENGLRIMSWIKGQPTDQKAPTTVTATEDTRSNGDMVEVSRSPEPYQPPPPPAAVQGAQAAEMADDHIAELPDTSRPPELSDTGMTPVNIVNRHFAGSPSNPSSHQTSYMASVSGNETSGHTSAAARGPGSRADSPSRGPSPESPNSPVLGRAGVAALAASGAAGAAAGAAAAAASTSQDSVNNHNNNKSRVASDVSVISDREAGHLRQLSQDTVSSASDSEEPNKTAPLTASFASATTTAKKTTTTSTSTSPFPSPVPAGVPPQHIPIQTSPLGTPPLEEEEGRAQQYHRGQSSPSLLSPAGTVSPPTADIINESDDYLSAKGSSGHASPLVSRHDTQSPARRSIFRESDEDMGHTSKQQQQ